MDNEVYRQTVRCLLDNVSRKYGYSARHQLFERMLPHSFDQAMVLYSLVEHGLLSDAYTIEGGGTNSFIFVDEYDLCNTLPDALSSYQREMNRLRSNQLLISVRKQVIWGSEGKAVSLNWESICGRLVKALEGHEEVVARHKRVA